MPLVLIPLTLAQANQLVLSLHRHHKPVVGHRFSLGLEQDGKLVGAVIVGRPKAKAYDQYRVAEVTRLVTDGTKNACSFLYAAAARVAREMGFDKIQTYILVSEPGTSLRAAGWSFNGIGGGRSVGPHRIAATTVGARSRKQDRPAHGAETAMGQNLP